VVVLTLRGLKPQGPVEALAAFVAPLADEYCIRLCCFACFEGE
jgi:hypothetical protein